LAATAKRLFFHYSIPTVIGNSQHGQAMGKLSRCVYSQTSSSILPVAGWNSYRQAIGCLFHFQVGFKTPRTNLLMPISAPYNGEGVQG